MLRALVVTGSTARLRAVGEYATAEEAVLRLRADLDAQAGRALPGRLAAAVGAATRQDAAAVAAAVLGPLLADIGDRDLVVVPTGILLTVPWAALPGCAGRPGHGGPVGHRVAGCPAPVGRSAAPAGRCPAGPAGGRAGQRPRRRRSPGHRRAVPPGPRADRRGRDARRHPGRLDAAAIAHLAAHGQHRSENALFSTLELAGAPLLGYDLHAGTGPTHGRAVLL